MKRTNTRLYVWLKTQRKYRSLQRRLLTQPDQVSSHFLRKLDLLRKRLFDLNRKWKLGVSTAAMIGWMAAIPAQAQNPFPTNFNVASVDGTNGFTLNGKEGEHEQIANSVSSAGDINGDGIDDVIIGAKNSSLDGINNAGRVYVVFGKSEAFDKSPALSALDGTNGFVIKGANAQQNMGSSVSAAGDFNGDGIGDFMIGAQGAGSYNGEAYVIFGKTTAYTAIFDLSSLDGTNGFKVHAGNTQERLGSHLADLGDINNDGASDILITAEKTDNSGMADVGRSYIILGEKGGLKDSKSGELAANFQAASLDGTNGFMFNGSTAYERVRVGAGAGDVNADGIDDLIIGSRLANGVKGECYVIYGTESGFSASYDKGSLDGTNGFAILGDEVNISIGNTVSAAGDINGDGIDDFMIGGNQASNTAGHTYVIFGQESNGFGTSIAVSTLDGSNGFILKGESYYDYVGASVSEIGDLNGDGFDDIAIGSGYYSSKGHVIFGKDEAFTSSLKISEIDGANGFNFSAGGEFGPAVSSAGDVNNDGAPDLIIGSPNNKLENIRTGSAFVVFGKKNNEPAIANALPDLALDEGFATKTIDLVNTFSDADGDALTLSATSNDEAVATVAISGTTLTITEVALGMATVIVTADDGRQTNVTDRFELEVAKNNTPTVANALDDLSLEEGFATKTIDLANTFADVDGDALTFSVASSDESILKAELSGNELTLTEVSNGIATVTVTADDGRTNGKVTDEFATSIATPLGIQNSDFKGLTLYPNPSTSGNITVQIGEIIDGKIVIRDIRGKKITQQRVLRSNQVMVDLSNETAGLYFISIWGTNQKSAQLRILKK